MTDKRNKRFPLLLYRRYHQIHSGLSKLLIILGIMLVGFAMAIQFLMKTSLSGEAIQAILVSSLAVSSLGIVRLLFTFLVSKTAYVECQARVLKIRTPFLPLVISYKRIRNTRPTVLREVFPPEKQKRGRQLLEAFWGETVVVVEISKLPMPPGFLKAMMGPHFFHPDGSGLVLLVEDWMGFSQSLDQALTDYRTQRVAPVSQRGAHPR